MKTFFYIIQFFICISAFAKINSNVLYLPSGGTSSFSLSYDLGQGKFTSTGTPPFNVQYSANLINFDYMWGINNEMSMGATINTGENKGEYTSGTTKFVSKATGLSDLKLKFRMNQENFIYGADLGLPLGVHTIDNNDVSNRSSGGISIIPMIGMVFNNGSFNFGGHITYNYLLDRKGESESGTTTSTRTTSGGNSLILTPFTEWNFGSGFISLQYSIMSASDSTVKASDGTNATNKSDNINEFKISGNYDFNESITGLAGYTLSMLPANSDASRPATTLTTINLGIRFVF